ncbi:MAG TPA: hypothetical protein VFA59_25005 [Vicinamibacterales bacterium]|nr:hypothetical protein [Vicinamibacterales bacterium]
MGWRRAIIAATMAAVVFGAYVRFKEESDVFCQSPDEMSEVMPGTRLHGLPLFNLSAPTRYNFFRSMFYSQHGLGDVSFYYLGTGALTALHIPTSERNLYVLGGMTNLAFAAAGGVFAAYVLGSAPAGWIFALLVLVSPFYVFVSKTGWARLTWTPLLLVLVMIVEVVALRRRSVAAAIGLSLLAGFVALTDGFIMLPVVGVIAWQAIGGPHKLMRLVRDPIVIGSVAAIALAVAVDVAVGVMAHRRGSGLTMISYVLVRGGSGVVPSLHVLGAWLQSIDYYFPFRGASVVVLGAFVAAVVAGVRGDPIGAVAFWFALASAGLIRYAGAVEAINPTSVPGFLNAYYIAPPSLLLVAWLCARLAERRIGWVATIAIVLVAAAMARQSWIVAFAEPPRPDIAPNRLVKYTDMPLSACRTVKAAAYYIRSHEHGTLPYVFHLSSDPYVGHIGEFYYGLSYSRSSKPEDPNHLLDFGYQQFGHYNPPETFYKPYGVAHFDYYVEFAEERIDLPTDRPFAASMSDRLRREGARVVCTIWDNGRAIGRVLSFDGSTPVDIEYRAAASAWDRAFARTDRLMQEPLAGTSYHFGYNWRPPAATVQ